MSKQEIKQVKPQDLIPYAKNSRTHTDAQIKQVMRSIEEFGFTNPILLHKNTILAGHCRVEAAKRLGIKTVPCLSLDYLTPDQARAYVIADNKLAINAGWDDDVLKQEIEDLLKADFDISLIGFDTSEFKDLGVESFAPEFNGDPDDVPEVPQNVHGACRGDIWQLGEHRLMCGDSAESNDVSRLMAGKLADMVFTDPPYGVSYDGTTTKSRITIESDDFDENKLTAINNKWFNCVDVVTRPGSYLLATVPPGPLHLVFAADWKDRGWLRQIMVWNKSEMVLGWSEYHYKHEPILFGWKPGGNRLANTDRTKTTVWDFAKPSRSAEHPTMKPVEMWEYGISNHSVNGSILYEPFSGSGTCLIACEKTGRICYGMEIDPHYCSVIIERWQQFTGKKAEKIA